MTKPIYIDAQPVAVGDRLSVWKAEDVPNGVLRGPSSIDVDGALLWWRHGTHVLQAPDPSEHGRFVVVPRWALQPRPVATPRMIDARPALYAAHKGFAIWRVTDIPPDVPHGISTDTIAFAERLWLDYGVRRAERNSIYAGVAWDTLQPKLGSEEIVGESRSITQPTEQPKPSLADTYNGKRLPDTFSLAACTGEQVNRRSVSPEARAAWSAELRQLQHKARERERLQVLVDLDVEPWE